MLYSTWLHQNLETWFQSETKAEEGRGWPWPLPIFFLCPYSLSISIIYMKIVLGWWKLLFCFTNLWRLSFSVSLIYEDFSNIRGMIPNYFTYYVKGESYKRINNTKKVRKRYHLWSKLKSFVVESTLNASGPPMNFSA